MVSALHRAGIEVILDVVYNHTAEGNHRGPTLSFRGIDNRAYYRLQPDQPAYYSNYTGTGNSMNTTHASVLQLIMDSLRYWVQEMHVDGFRFDLASTLAREIASRGRWLVVLRRHPAGSGAQPRQVDRRALGRRGRRLSGRELSGALERMERPVSRRDARLLARGAIGGDVCVAICRQLRSLCAQPPARRRASTSSPRTTASRCAISSPTTRSTTRPTATTIRTGNHTIARGTAALEGPTEDRSVNRLRARQQRNLLTTLLVSQGVPMLLAGDERGRTQHGNNNAYCQDNADVVGRLAVVRRRPAGVHAARSFVCDGRTRPSGADTGCSADPRMERAVVRMSSG